jgi:hypothetical protein
MVTSLSTNLYLVWLAILIALGFVLVIATPLGTPVKNYLALTSKFTTPSIPLFMTVQEYEPTGFNFNFGSAGFGIIGASLGGVSVIIWLVLVVFTLLALVAIFKRDSNSSVLSFWIIWPLAIGAMIEIKYLPHFGVAYILALVAIFGELYMFLRGSDQAVLVLFAIAIVIVIFESFSYISVFAAAGGNCTTVSQNNPLGASMFCNVVPNYWLNALSWMKKNVGPDGPRVLAWWDYGDWINWFGNSNAVLRGDNAVATLDYATAARFVLGPQLGYGESNLANFSNEVQAKYVLFDDQLTAKWQALNFLACVHANQTSRAFAISQANGTGEPYALGTSQCEQEHSPAILLVPTNTSSIDSYCSLQKKNMTFVKGYVVVGDSFSNQTFCLPLTNSSSAQRLYYSNGTISNAEIVPVSQFFYGLTSVQGQDFLSFMILYLPNGPNSTITNAPSQFYQSNYYKGFYLGSLKGFKMVYPLPGNFVGINYANSVNPVVIYEVDNYTGTLPAHIPKPSWVLNNFTMPG